MSAPEDRRALDVEAIAAKWLQVCGGCDAGMGPCTHPTDDDYRNPMSALISELQRLRCVPGCDTPAACHHGDLDAISEALGGDDSDTTMDLTITRLRAENERLDHSFGLLMEERDQFATEDEELGGL